MGQWALSGGQLEVRCSELSLSLKPKAGLGDTGACLAREPGFRTGDHQVLPWCNDAWRP